jgi:hypothetical protein
MLGLTQKDPLAETLCQSLLRVVRWVSRRRRCEVVAGSCYGRQWLFPLSSPSQYTGSTLSPMSLHLSAPCFRTPCVYVRGPHGVGRLATRVVVVPRNKSAALRGDFPKNKNIPE